jgi:hypothetical protein
LYHEYIKETKKKKKKTRKEKKIKVLDFAGEHGRKAENATGEIDPRYIYCCRYENQKKKEKKKRFTAKPNIKQPKLIHDAFMVVTTDFVGNCSYPFPNRKPKTKNR